MSVADGTQLARLVALGMLCFVAMTHFRMWRIRRHDRAFALFAGWAALTFVFVLASYLQQASATAGMHSFAIHLAATCLLLLGPLSLYTAREVAQIPSGRGFNVLVALLLVALPFVWLGDRVVDTRRVVYLAFDGSAIVGCAQTLGLKVMALSALAVPVYLAVQLRRAQRPANSALTRVRYATFLLLLPAFANDVAFNAGLINTMVVLDFALAGIVLVHSGYVFHQATIAFGELDGLVLERTRELATSRASLARSEGMVRRVLAALPDTVCILRNGRIDYVNHAGSRLFGRARSELINQPLAAFVAADHEGEFAQVYGAMARRTRPGPASEVHLDCGAGTRTVELSGLVMEFEGDSLVLAILRDVTAKHLLLAELQTADRLASVGKLAAGVAHEINNPLTYVLANLCSVRDALQEDALLVRDELVEWLDESVEGTERIARIVRDLRSVGRPDEETRAVEVHEVLRQSLNMARVGFHPSISLVDRIQPVPLVQGTKGRLGQVFLNILVNAGQAIPEGNGRRGTIAVQTQVDEAGDVVIEISDTGVGIPDAIRRTLFEPFVSSKPMGVGSGLGLAISHGIVTTMGGSIELLARDGGGTVARVVLPAVQVPDVASARIPVEASSSVAAQRRILVVDDEPAVRRSIQRVLRDYDVTAVGSGIEAVEALTEGVFDMVMCDLMMPTVDGIDVYEHFRSLNRSAEFVFMSGGVCSAGMAERLAKYDVPLLSKPLLPDALRAEVSRRV